MGIQTIRTVTEELQISITDMIRKAFTENSSSFDFSVASPRTHGIRIGSHKDITGVTDGRTGGKDDP